MARAAHLHRITINRAPVLTLWGAVVAQRLGFRWDEALTLGRAVAGLNAYSKGVALGLFQPTPGRTKEQRRKMRDQEVLAVDLLGRRVPACMTAEGLRAVSKGKPIDPKSVDRYVRDKFGAALPATRAAMRTLAFSVSPRRLTQVGFKMYEAFRPDVPEGAKGWGAAGRLDLNVIRAMARR